MLVIIGKRGQNERQLKLVREGNGKKKVKEEIEGDIDNKQERYNIIQ